MLDVSDRLNSGNLRRSSDEVHTYRVECILLLDNGEEQTLVNLAAGILGSSNAVSFREVSVEIHPQAGGAGQRP